MPAGAGAMDGKIAAAQGCASNRFSRVWRGRAWPSPRAQAVSYTTRAMARSDRPMPMPLKIVNRASAGRVAPAFRLHTKRGDVIDHRALERGDEIPHAELRAPQIDQWIHHELPGPVIRHLPTAIDLDYRNVSGREQMGTTRIHAQREDGRMFEEPDLVRRFFIALIREPLHGAPRGLVLDETEPADHGGGYVTYTRRGSRGAVGRHGVHGLRRHGHAPARSYFAAASALLFSPALLRFSACSAR